MDCGDADAGMVMAVEESGCRDDEMQRDESIRNEKSGI